MSKSVVVTHRTIQQKFGKTFCTKLDFPQINIVHLLCEGVNAKVTASMVTGNLKMKINPQQSLVNYSSNAILPATRLLEYPIQKHFDLFTLMCIVVHALTIN